MEVSLTPRSEAFVQKAISSGKTVDEIINRVIASLRRELESDEPYASWLQAEIQKGDDSGLLDVDFDFAQAKDRVAFWSGIDGLSDKMLTNELPTTPDSAALSLIHS